MAIIVDGTCNDSISIEEFTERARQVDLEDEDAILTLAPDLRKLAQNKNLLRDFIQDGLADVANFQRDNVYSSQSYILSNVTELSFLRFAVWAPLSYGEELDENNFYSYDTAHNHDFSLLTAGMLGSGYTTSIYQLEEGQDPVGYVGEDIRLTEAQVVQLSPGRVILYEAGKDIHIQHPAADLSISLNLIVDQTEKHTRQLYYDVKNQKIAGYVANRRMKRGALLRYASILNDAQCNETLQEIAKEHPCDSTRLYAFRALAASADTEVIKEDMLKDHSPMVRSSLGLIDTGFSKLNIWG